MDKRLNEVLDECSEGDEIICTQVAPINDGYLTVNKGYKVHAESNGDLYIIDDDGDKLADVDSFFEASIQRTGVGQYTINPDAQLAKCNTAPTVTSGKPVPPKGEWLENVINSLCAGDYVRCVEVDSRETDEFTQLTVYEVQEDRCGGMFIEGDDGIYYGSSYSKFIQRTSVVGCVRSSVSAAEPTQSNDEKDKPRSVVDGDYSQYCTWDVEDPETKTSEWKPDTIREDIDIMESIRHACNRT